MCAPFPEYLFEPLSKVLMLDEGVAFGPYLDTQKNWTIGIGHLIGKQLTDLKLSKNVVLTLLREDLEVAWQDACEIFGEDFLAGISQARQVACLSLAYSLGRAKLQTFHQTIPAIIHGQWQQAAQFLKASKWASDVDPKRIEGQGRDDRIAKMLKTGDFDEAYNLG